jgi:hypothetical protein
VSRQSYRLIAGLVIFFWLLMMGLLVYREVLQPRWHRYTTPAIAAHPQDLWMGIFVAGDERVGYLNLRTTPDERAGSRGTRMDLSLKMTLSLLERHTDLWVSGTAFQAEGSGIRDLDFQVRSGDHEMRLQGEVENRSLRGTIETGGETIPLQLPVQDNVLLGGATGLGSANVPLLEAGQVAFVDSFDPTTMSMGRTRLEGEGMEEIQVRGERVQTYVVSANMNGIESRAWVTPEGEVLQAETPFGFQLRAISPEEALAPVTPTEKASLIRTLAVQVAGNRPERGAQELRVRFSGVPETELPPESEWQTRDGDVYTLRAPNDPSQSPIQPLSREEATEYLASDPFITADHERIEQFARELLQSVEDPWQQAQRIYEWTWNNIEKISVISVPSALEVLRTRQGDCNEHTILFAAVARAAGIPTRVAIGLVWSDEINGFGYHAWPEVYVGQWTPMDPTLGQPLADATHIKLLEGSIERWTQLVPYIGKLQIEVL